MAGKTATKNDPTTDTRADAPSTAAYVRALRTRAGLSVTDVARRAGMSATWLERFEAGLDEQGVDYGELLALVRATQPPRPDWWDDGHEHDLHLPPDAVLDRESNPGYWARIERVRQANREAHR